MHDPHDESQDDLGDSSEAILIPWQKLSEHALIGVIEEFITREGTDYGQTEFSLEDKREEIMGQLRRGHVVIEFSPETETCTLRRTR